jgi:serine/threonine protein kinase
LEEREPAEQGAAVHAARIVHREIKPENIMAHRVGLKQRSCSESAAKENERAAGHKRTCSAAIGGSLSVIAKQELPLN